MSNNYKPTKWLGGKTIGTAQIMNNIEQGISNAHDRLDSVENGILSVHNRLNNVDSQIKEKANLLNEKIDEVANTGTTIEIVQNKVREMAQKGTITFNTVTPEMTTFFKITKSSNLLNSESFKENSTVGHWQDSIYDEVDEVGTYLSAIIDVSKYKTKEFISNSFVFKGIRYADSNGSILGTLQGTTCDNVFKFTLPQTTSFVRIPLANDEYIKDDIKYFGHIDDYKNFGIVDFFYDKSIEAKISGKNLTDNSVNYNKLDENLKKIIDKNENETNYDVKLNIAKKYYIIKDEETELFTYPMINELKEYNPFKYEIDLTYGNVWELYKSSMPLRFKKTLVGKNNDRYDGYFILKDSLGNEIERKQVYFYCADTSLLNNPVEVKNIAFFGDSTIAAGIPSNEFRRRLRDTGGIPVGLGLNNYKLVGKQTNIDSENRWTATGGYGWENFTKDPNTLPSPFNGNPIWNPTKNDIDFKYFSDTYCNSVYLDYVIVQLGWNNYLQESNRDYYTTNIDEMEILIKKFIDKLHSQYPNCKILLCSQNYSSNKISIDRQYYQKLNEWIFKCATLYDKIANTYPYNEFVTHVHEAIMIDSINNMPTIDVKNNSRNNNITTYCADNVHPSESGYLQMADAIFRAFCNIIKTS